MIFQKSWKKAKKVLAVMLAVALFFSGWGNYDFSVLAADELDVTLSVESAVYTGDEIDLPTASVKNGVDEVTDYSVKWTDEDDEEITGGKVTDTGIYKLEVTKVIDETPLTGTAKFEVKPLDLSGCTVEVEGTYTYNGSEFTPGVTVKNNDGNVVNESVYSVRYANNLNAGTGSVKVDAVEGNTNVSGSKTVNFSIAAKPLSDDMLNVVVEPSVANAADQTVHVTVEDGSTTIDSSDYTVTYKCVQNGVESDVAEITLAGTYNVYVQAKDNTNYTGTISKEITVSYAEVPTDPLTYEGNTFKIDVYAGDVVVKPASGYKVSDSEAGSYTDSIRYTESQTEGKLYLQNISNNFISEATRKAFKIDSTAPSNLTAECADADVWKSSKTVSVSVTEEESGCSLYYAETDVLAGTSLVNENTVLSGLTEFTGSFEVTENIGTTAKSYYVYAINDAGYVTKTSVDVSKVDNVAPVINIETAIENYDGSTYWKNSRELQIPISISDSAELASGIISIEISPDSGLELDSSYATGDKTYTGNLKVTNAGTYTIKVTDQAGNEVEKEITIKQDSKAPEITLSEPSGNNKYLDGNNQVYWFSGDSVEVPLRINDEVGSVETEKAPYTVIYSTSQYMSAPTEITISSDEGTADINLSSEGTVTTYYFQVKDRAGNTGDIKEVKLAYDTTSPDISAVSLSQQGDDEWINYTESGKTFENELTKVKFSVTASDIASGIKKIEYSSDNGNTYHTAITSFSDNKYTFTTYEGYADGTGYQWAVRITDNVGNIGDWVSVSGGKIDTTAPSTTAYIKFISDTEGANDVGRGSVTDGKWISNIYEMATEAWNKIWGKETVKFEVYVQDVTSGIDTISMSYNGSELSLTKVDGLKAFTEGDSDVTDVYDNDLGYTVFEGRITYAEVDGLAVRNFQIDSLTDVAGNTTKETEKIVLGNAASTDIIYLDAVAPVLSVAICDDNSANSNLETNILTEEKYFYNNSKKMVLTIDERFFGQENTPVYPTVNLFNRNNVEAAFSSEAVATTSTWTQIPGTNKWQAEISLPLVANQETEYQVRMSAYADPSGNVLVGDTTANHAVSAGVFTSKIYVIDAVEPKLVEYSVNESTECNNNGIAIFKNNTSENDLTVTFVLDDHAEYYEKSKDKLSVKLYKDTETSPILSMTEDSLEKEFDGRNHKYSFSYDGTATTENEFYVEISYEDAAGNLMTDGRPEAAEGTVNPGMLASGTYTSEKYIIDHIAPEFNVIYSDASNVVKDGVSDTGKKPLSGHTAYYNGNINVTLTFDEKYVNANSDDSLQHFELELYKDGASDPLIGTALTNVIQNVNWTHSGTVHTAMFTLKADSTNHITDGNYQFVVKYRDCAENAMIPAKDEDGNLLNPDLANLMSIGTEADTNTPVGIYTSPVLVMDTTEPIVTTSYVKFEGSTETIIDPAQTINDAKGIERDYFKDENAVFKINIEDRNIRYGELKTVLNDTEVYDINDAEINISALKTAIGNMNATGVQCIKGNISSNQNTWTVNLPLLTCANYDIPVDFTDLAGNRAVVNGASGTYTEYVTMDYVEPELTLDYSIKDPANYWEWGYWFAKGQLDITVNAVDDISGVHWIKYTIVDEKGNITYKNKDFVPVGSTTHSISIPLETRNFKGSVKAEVYDYSTNMSEKTRGHIVESTEKHSETGKAVIQTLTSPSRIVRGIDFYNTDVKFKLTLEDTYSGIASWKYKGGVTLDDTKDYKAQVGTDLEADRTETSNAIRYLYEKELTLAAASNNKNDVPVTASFIDNVGHETSVEQKYNIDITKPEIKVTYDLNEPANEKYYNQTRTATVEIRERNFDESDVEFLITSTDGSQPSISGWSSTGSGDDTTHTCTVRFEDDSDYTFTLKFQDMAGNDADYNRVDEFTIDKTIPVATVTYDNNQFLNEYYYDATRTATIDIFEHNFDPGAMNIMVTMDGNSSGVPGISSWASNGDHNIATITFREDAEYTFDFEGLDLALNELADYTPDHFVVDMTAPELEIFDIENMSANNGEVRPGIRYYDTNYDEDGTVILMNGYHNGVVEMTGERKLEAKGLELKLDDFAYEQDVDDLYTMEATVYDLAGNSSEETVMFSVNRFGSVYTFDEATDALIGDNGKYYTNQEQELVITETNVDTLEFKEITCNLNGKLSTLKEGQDYSVSVSGDDATWKQYTYNVHADNFKEEGTYILNIYSEDRATNTSDNNSKGKKVEFVVDKTNPSVLISGVENNGQYRAHSQEMTIDIEDNVRLSQMKVSIDGTETIFGEAEIREADGKFVMNIESANHWQEIKVVVTDAAGNEEILQDLRVLVTANVLVQFYMNKPVFYGTVGGTSAVAASIWWTLIGRKKYLIK